MSLSAILNWALTKILTYGTAEAFLLPLYFYTARQMVVYMLAEQFGKQLCLFWRIQTACNMPYTLFRDTCFRQNGWISKKESEGSRLESFWNFINFAEDRCPLGRCYVKRGSQNLGIAKKGGSDPCQGGFDTVHRVLPGVITQPK